MIQENYINAPTLETKPFHKREHFFRNHLLNSVVEYLDYRTDMGDLQFLSSNDLWRTFPKYFLRSATFRTLYDALGESGINCWPFVYCHGDLWAGNVLADKQAYYVIDFEEFGKRLFFYDLFDYIAMDAIWGDDITFVDNYLDSDYDVSFEEVFDVVGLNYNKTERALYLGLVVAQRLFYYRTQFGTKYARKWLELVEYAFEYSA